MSEINELLDATKQTVKKVLKILESKHEIPKKMLFDKKIKREIKSKIDKDCEKIIINDLLKTSIPMLSEETEGLTFSNQKGLLWVIDPLDGTVNYLRNFGNCSVSIALFKDNEPVFGVIGEFPSKSIFWGGPKIKSFKGKEGINVSKINNKKKAILCTGFPSRYIFNRTNEKNFFEKIKKFSKIRMIGSASLSLIKLSQGQAEAYLEENIMIWDVAAGLAILRGSGGKYKISKGSYKNAINVIAHNGVIL